jgi:predicted TIM-barrel fold metal-dependent hydrolase
MLIVDAQVHIWGTGLPTNPAHRQITSFLAEDLLKEMDEAGVDAAVIHPPGWDPNSNQLAIEAARQHPNRLSILGNFPLDWPESRDLVPGWKQNLGMLGLRFSFQGAGQENWPTDGTMDWLWPAAEEAGLPVGLACANFLPVVGQVAERHPGLKLIVDHMGRGQRATDEAAFETLPDLLALAKYPNVACKASGAPSYSSAPYPFANIHEYLHQIFDAFGPDRTFWGTDITRMPCSWRQCVTLFTEELPWLTGEDLEKVMGRALCRWIGWDLPGV